MKSLILVSSIIIYLSYNYSIESTYIRSFRQDKDLISLHYDHAGDRDDGESAAADRTVLQTIYGKAWIKEHIVAASGMYGDNYKLFRAESDLVMTKVWTLRLGGWITAHKDRSKAIRQLVIKWSSTLRNGGDVWVKEGGQSDNTAEIVYRLRQKLSRLNTNKRIHVIQHGKYNEDHTNPKALRYLQEYTDYIKLEDQNKYLQSFKDEDRFISSALSNRRFKKIWQAAFNYLNPEEKIDFSDTGELLYILRIGPMNIENFRQTFLEE
jgi:hypothetical protein